MDKKKIIFGVAVLAVVVLSCIYLLYNDNAVEHIAYLVDKTVTGSSKVPEYHAVTVQSVNFKLVKYVLIGVGLLLAMGCGVLAAALYTEHLHKNSIIIETDPKPSVDPKNEIIPHEDVSRLRKWYQECLAQFSNFGLTVLLTTVVSFILMSFYALYRQPSLSTFALCPYVAMVSFGIATLLTIGLALPSWTLYVLSTSCAVAVHLLIALIKRDFSGLLKKRAVYMIISIVFGLVLVVIGNMFWSMLVFGFLVIITASTSHKLTV